MKKLSILAVIAAIVMVFASCGSVKNVAYLKNSDSVDLSNSSFLYDARIMPKDILTISVSTVNPEAALPFNLSAPLMSQVTSIEQVTSNSNRGTFLPYLVDNQGNIEFPVIGTLHVGGLTKNECEKMILSKIMRYINENENPVVTVRMANYKISVIGEVARPGMFTVDNEKINIFEALAKAGDLTIYGVRNKVKLIREDAQGRKEIHTLNLNDAGIIQSPYYYLQQNDIVYVEPNKVKARNSSIGQSTSLWLTSTSILISLSSLLYNILKK